MRNLKAKLGILLIIILILPASNFAATVKGNNNDLKLGVKTSDTITIKKVISSEKVIVLEAKKAIDTKAAKINW